MLRGANIFIRLLLTGILLTSAVSASAAAPSTHAWPLWDGHESAAEYAQRANLPATQTLDLGDGVALELVLIPAAKFQMGVAEPAPVDEAGFASRILIGKTALGASLGVLSLMLVWAAVRAARARRRPQLSLAQLTVVTLAAGGAVLASMHWQRSIDALQAAQMEFRAAKLHYDAAGPREKPAHTVTLTKPFYMGKFAVTQAQYRQLMSSHRSGYMGATNPVEFVSWYDAQDFCAMMSVRQKRHVRLPTEAEWEFSCRAGTTTTYYSGDREQDLDRVAWYAPNSKATTHPVGMKPPNAFGLYDMHGNVWQWCEDWEGGDYYSRSPAEDPRGPDSGQYRVYRGGCLEDGPDQCRATYRYAVNPYYSGSYIGFRVVVDVE